MPFFSRFAEWRGLARFFRVLTRRRSSASVAARLEAGTPPFCMHGGQPLEDVGQLGQPGALGSRRPRAGQRRQAARQCECATGEIGEADAPAATARTPVGKVRIVSGRASATQPHLNVALYGQESAWPMWPTDETGTEWHYGGALARIIEMQRHKYSNVGSWWTDFQVGTSCEPVT